MRSASQLAKATGAPKTLNTIRPAGAAVSSDSDKLTNSIPGRNEKKASKTNKNLILPVTPFGRSRPAADGTRE
jgi:hypothetical protein